MKTRYNTYDIICTIVELQKFIGMRVNNIYDIDNKTYLIRLQRTEEKQVLLLESGIRIHSTSFEWPKNVAPSGFSMKMRKHLKNKRLESLTQLGMDRIVDLTFGSGEAAYHVIIELFDRGNMLLTDHEYTILYVLRPHTEGDKMKFAVKEKYPLHRARSEGVISREKIIELITGCKQGDQLKKVLVPNLEYGPPMIEHVLRLHGLTGAAKIGKDFNISNNIDDLMAAINDAENLFQKSLLQHNEGYIIQKKEERVATDGNSQSDFFSNQEFHPILFEQHKLMPHKSFTSFNEAVDEFFSSLESQKLELRAVQQEKDAMKKLENVRKDHNQRLQALEKTQNVDKQKAELITRNQELVDSAILAVQTLLANQISWEDIEDMVKTAASKGDPVAKHIKQLKLEMNHISLHLSDPFEAYSVDSDDENNDDKLPPMIIEIDLALSAFANARKYYNQKRTAAKKQQKTIESQSKALKSAERKTKQTLKEVQTITNINKARKVYWFEKFFWFVSSENYLVIAGRDQQQNELIVKRYMKPTDIYVHADIHGASSVIIKNPNGLPVPPKTLNEAGTMAICYSVAWDAKIVTNAYWVWGEQVSKTAPTGEYLTTGSFMIRGKKNFLPPTHLILGLSFLFRLEDSYIEKHKGERKVMNINENDETNIAANEEDANEVEVEINDSDGNEDDKETETSEVAKEKLDGENKLEDISEHSSSDSEDDTQFPDTHIKIQHFAGTKVNLMTENTKPSHDSEQQNSTGIGQNKLDNKKQTKDKNKPKNENRVRPAEEKDSQNAKQQVSKRGQKSKLKKIKEKYKDQDEEERKMRMEILQSSGTQKDNRKSKKGKEETSKRKPEPRIPRAPAPKEPGGDDADDEPTVQADVDVIDALTGVPATEDELLFAVPVVAPYNALSSYKFKVKLTPGTAKRGKAAKTAVAIFLKDRAISTREKDLLKAVKDEQLARNIPGKVKLSAPKLQVNRK